MKLLPSQARSAQAIDVSAADFSDTSGAVPYIGVAGDIKVDMADKGTAVTFSNVPVGIFPIVVTKVYNADTTASGIVLLEGLVDKR